MKKFCFILCFLSVCFFSNGQTITIDNTTFDVGPYGQGSSITVPITTTDCFNVGNVFNLYLSDNSGNFVGNGTLIGSFNGFFTTFVNGIIPASTPAGTGYRLRVVSTNPASVISNTTNSFVINATAGVVAKANPSSQDLVLTEQVYFGWCSNIQNNNISLINQSTVGATVTASLKNEATSVVSNPSLSSNQFNISVAQNYYTITVKAVNGGNVGTISYFIINSPNKMALSTNGEQRGCLPDNLQFQFITNASIGIGDNFPGTQYRVDWGDGSSTFYKHCELVKQNGLISHPYVKTSCNEVGGAFSVTATLQNPFYLSGGTSVLQNCDQPQINTKARVFLKATAKFTFTQYACENKVVTFNNTSDGGQGQSGTSCNSSAKYGWYVNGVLINTTTADTYLSSPLNFTYTFPTPGKYAVMLTIYNGSCDTARKVDTICIEPTPIPNFTIAPAPCVPTSFTPVNTTNSNPCRPMTFAWSILDSLGNNTVNTGYYTISSTSASQPLITITKPGKYQLQLAVTNSCSTVVKRQTITVGGIPTATLPAGQSYCGIKTIDFATDINHKPTYDSQFGNTLTYTWFVSNPIGGTSSFVGGTTVNSAYPQIQFNNVGTYVVQLTYSNNCGLATTVSQQITFKEIPTFTLPANQIVCGGLATTAVNFISSPAGANFTWTNNNASIGLAISGNGNIGSFTTVNQAAQQVATITATPTLNGCPGTAGSFTITVNTTPPLPTANTAVALCQNTTASALTATASAGNTLKWYDASNTLLPGAPTPSTATAGNTTYYVSQVNTLSSCEGSKLAIIVTVNPETVIDTLSTKNPSVCQGSDGTITIKGLVANTVYTLNYSKNGTAIAPLTITANGSGNYVITGLSAGAYTNITVTRNNCPSNTLNPISLADPSAPATPVITSNSPICSGASIILSAISATSGVSYS